MRYGQYPPFRPLLPAQVESPLNLEIIRLIDAYFREYSHSGVITICAYLCFSKGYPVNVKRIRRLMRLTAVTIPV